MQLRNRGMSLVELLVVIAIIMLLIGLLLPALSGARAQSRRIKDSAQVRTIVQSLTLFAHGNRGRYPLPGLMWKPASTNNIQGISGEQLNTTGNILSAMIFGGFFTVEGCISPLESNVDQVRRKEGFQFTAPSATPDIPWDPTFRGTPIDDPRTFGSVSTTRTDPGNNSYAHPVMVGKRRALWSDTTPSVVPVFGNRGPTYRETAAPPGGRYSLTDNATGTGSYTLLIHPPRHTWEGNVGHNDGHISFETRPDPTGLTYRSADSTSPTRRDNLFINESDELGGDTAPTQFSRGRNIIFRPISRVTGANPNYTFETWVD